MTRWTLAKRTRIYWKAGTMLSPRTKPKNPIRQDCLAEWVSPSGRFRRFGRGGGSFREGGANLLEHTDWTTGTLSSSPGLLGRVRRTGGLAAEGFQTCEEPTSRGWRLFLAEEGGIAGWRREQLYWND